MNIFQSITAIFGANVLFSACSLLNSAIIARLLGPELKGELTVFFLVASVAALILRMGLDVSVVRRLKDPLTLPSIAAVSAFLTTIGFVLIGTSLYYFLISASTVIPIEIRTGNYHSFIYAVIIFETLTVLLSSILVGQERIKEYSGTLILLPSCTLIFLLLLVTSGAEIDVATVVTITAAAYLVKFSAQILLLRNIVLDLKDFHLKTSVDMTQFGLKSHVGNVLDFFIVRSDIFILSAFYDLKVVGIYSIAILAEKINLISASVGTGILSKIKTLEDHVWAEQISRLALIFIAAANALIYLTSEVLLTLVFGEKFSDAVVPFTILFFGFSILFFSKIIKPFFIIADQPLILSKASSICLGLNIAANLLLIPNYGMLGASIATTIANIFYTGYLISRYLKITSGNMTDLLVPKYKDWILIRNWLGKRS